MKVEFLINGKKTALNVGPLKALVDILRDDLAMKGTKKGNSPAEYGCELVFLNGELVDASLIPAFRVDKGEILTIEGIKQRKDFPDYERIVREVLKGNDRLYCAGNIVMLVKALFMEKKNNDIEAVKEALSEVICSEIGFSGIVEGVKRLSSLRGKRIRG